MKNRKFLMIGAGVVGVFFFICITCIVLVNTTMSSPGFQATTTAQALARVTQTTRTASGVASTPIGISQPTQTALPTSTSLPPTSTQTPTIVPVKISAKQIVNVRQGPGTQFAVVGKLQPNTSVTVIGKSEDGQWLQIPIPDAANLGWVSVSVVTVIGSLNDLVMVKVSPTATRTVALATGFSASEIEYLTSVGEIANVYADALKHLGKMLSDAGNDSSVIFDGDWRLSVATDIVLIQASGKQLRSLKPSTRLANLHADWLDAANHLDKAVDLLVEGIDTLNAKKIDQARAEMILGNAAITRANEKLNKLIGK